MTFGVDLQKIRPGKERPGRLRLHYAVLPFTVRVLGPQEVTARRIAQHAYKRRFAGIHGHSRVAEIHTRYAVKGNVFLQNLEMHRIGLKSGHLEAAASKNNGVETEVRSDIHHPPVASPIAPVEEKDDQLVEAEQVQGIHRPHPMVRQTDLPKPTKFRRDGLRPTEALLDLLA